MIGHFKFRNHGVFRINHQKRNRGGPNQDSEGTDKVLLDLDYFTSGRINGRKANKKT